MTKYILINGKKRHGKNHVSELMVKELERRNFKVLEISFADPIKRILAKSLSISSQNLDYIKNNPDTTSINIVSGANNIAEISGRSLIQKFGTEAMKKEFGEDVWTNLLLQKSKEQNVDFVVVPDFRFLIEEIEGAICINVFNDNIKDEDEHRSENELNDFNFDFYINNTGKPDLAPQIKKITTNILNYFKV